LSARLVLLSLRRALRAVCLQSRGVPCSRLRHGCSQAQRSRTSWRILEAWTALHPVGEAPRGFCAQSAAGHTVYVERKTDSIPVGSDSDAELPEVVWDGIGQLR
jgi:hypothetical protein